MQTVLSWNTVFDPQNDRVISPISRKWSFWDRGYVIYLWHIFFAAYQAAAFGRKKTAYVNAVEMTRAKGSLPFVPNVEQANGFKSRDRSQPPVGCIAVREVYRKFRKKWFLELLYSDLLEWNNWWRENRNYDGLRNYDFEKANQARKDLVEKSRELLLYDWDQRRYVRENYDVATGQGEIEKKSDHFYHWGGLLGLISLVEHDYIGAPDQPMD